MTEWLVEAGIGEERAVLVDDGAIVEARIEPDGRIPAGTILEARLTDVGRHGRNGVARDGAGAEYLLPSVPRDITQGAALNIEVSRPSIPGPEPWKRPLARATREMPSGPRSLAERLELGGYPVRTLSLPATKDELATVGWNDLLEEVRAGHVDFAGGSLGIFPTPAMTLIDIDGHLPPAELAIAGARASAGAIRRLDLGGSIGLDLPTVAGKDSRQKAANAVDGVLPQPFERTAVNGFGFLQIVRPRQRASLVELAQDRAGFEARALLRRAAFEGPGAKRLVAAPAVIALIEANAAGVEVLAAQIGGAVTLRSDPSLPIHGAYAEKP